MSTESTSEQPTVEAKLLHAEFLTFPTERPTAYRARIDFEQLPPTTPRTIRVSQLLDLGTDPLNATKLFETLTPGTRLSLIAQEPPAIFNPIGQEEIESTRESAEQIAEFSVNLGLGDERISARDAEAYESYEKSSLVRLRKEVYYLKHSPSQA